MFADLEAMVMVVQRIAQLEPVQADTEQQVALCALCGGEAVTTTDLVHGDCPWVDARRLCHMPIVGRSREQGEAPKAIRGIPWQCDECSIGFLCAEPYYVHVRNTGDGWKPLCEECGQRGVDEGSALIGNSVEVDTGWIVVPS